MKSDDAAFKINLVSVGDPLRSATWSGTPANIAKELARKNALGDAIDSSFSQNYIIIKAANRILNFLMYGRSVDKGRGIINRFENAIGLDLRLRRSTSKHTLHLGTLDLPLVTNFSRNKHYLLCDSTWNLWSSFSTHKGKYSNYLVKHSEQLEKRSYEQMTHIFTIGSYVKENLIDHYQIDPGKITSVGTGLGGIVPFFGTKDYSNKKILFVAKDRFEDKGGGLLIEAMKKIFVLDPEVKAYVVGQDVYQETLKLPNTHALGFISKELLQQLFNECSLYVMPAINEPWGLVYLEALACKMPIVGLNKNSFPEISGFGKYGFSLAEGNSEELAETILAAFQHPAKLEMMGLAAQEYCLSRFSWGVVVGKIIEKIKLYD